MEILEKKFWPPPEGTAPLPPEEKNPLIQLLMDVSSSQESLLEDHLLLTNRFNIHRCSDYCLTSKSTVVYPIRNGHFKMADCNSSTM